MTDPRAARLAKLLVHHSMKVKKGEKVLIQAQEAAKPLAIELYREVLQLGAWPILQVTFEETGKLWFDLVSEEILNTLPPHEMELTKSIQCQAVVRAPMNTHNMASTDPKRMAAYSRTMKPIQDHRMQHVRWVLCNYPTTALAQDADMSLDEYADFLYSACLVDYDEMSGLQRRIKDRLDKASTVRLIGPDTDLTLSIEGRTAIECLGSHNVPDGEVFLAPVETKVDGHIRYDYPAIRQGKEVAGVYLKFENGQVVEARADKNEDFLMSQIQMDAGAKFIGELGIGVNFGIQRFSKDILFDEKIGGSIHLALGMAYKEGGGCNESALHWDMIKDLRFGGEIHIDGQVVQRNGEFLL